MPDAVEPFGQDMQQEAPDELVGSERHGLDPLAPHRAVPGAIILPAERDAALVVRDEPVVGDGDAVRVARQIGEHRLRSAERTLGVDDPFGFSQGREVGRESCGIR